MSNTLEDLMSWLEEECFDLRCESYPLADTGDSTIQWIVYSHHMEKPELRYEGQGDSPLDALRHARFNRERKSELHKLLREISGMAIWGMAARGRFEYPYTKFKNLKLRILKFCEQQDPLSEELNGVWEPFEESWNNE